MKTKVLRVIFVNYGAFNSNSGGHIANFANHLHRLGHVIAVCATGDKHDPENRLDKGIHAFTHEEILKDQQAILACGEQADITILHLWTPRDNVINLRNALTPLSDIPYFVHLEDNEDVIAATNLGIALESITDIDPTRLPDPYPGSLSHPRRYRELLGKAAGVTVIVDRLREFVPATVGVMILEPGVDNRHFQDRLTPEEKAGAKAHLGIEDGSSVFVYHGNMHAANQRELFSLYTATMILNRRGRSVSFVRTGVDFTDGLDLSYPRHLQNYAKTLGFVDRRRLIEVLSIADFYVQPGASNPFNDYRFPSKLPEFLSMARPVVLPNANIGRRLRDGEDALLLYRGDGVEIADCVERILDNPDLAIRLGRNARQFAIQSLSWERNAGKLLEFYRESL